MPGWDFFTPNAASNFDESFGSLASFNPDLMFEPGNPFGNLGADAGFDQRSFQTSGQGGINPSFIQVTDSDTGRTMSLEDAIRLDPVAAQEFIQNQPGLFEALNFGGGVGTQAGLGEQEPTASGGVVDWLKNQNPLVLAGLGLTGLVGIGGLAGVIQKATQGNQVAKTEIQRIISGGSPEEKQALAEALRGISAATNFATGSPTSLQSQIGGRAPTEEAAFGLGAERLGQRSSIQDALQRVLGPETSQGVASILGSQRGIIDALNTAGQGLARGELNITPELARTVEQSFQPRMGDLATQLIEAARNRGFAGGADLLTQAPASALGQTALRDLQGQMAMAKLEAALALPRTAADIVGASNTPAALRLQGGTQLANLDQNIIAALGGLGQTGMGNRLDFLRAATEPARTAAGLASSQMANRINAGGQTSLTTAPGPSLLDAFAPLGGFLGGFGNSLVGLSLLSGSPVSSLSGLRR